MSTPQVQNADQQPVAKPASFKDKNPSNWEIVKTKTGVSARSNSTGETFEGTMADFNKLFKV